jgi:solute:Na+ symporter, SSS family
MHLTSIDWVIAAICLLICFVPALFFGKRAGRSTSEFFVSGRAVPWWLAGLSMVATTFSSDTPNLVTDIVRRNGVAGNWVWWAFVLTGVATVFFYARLWRRSGVMTDLEFYEIRYSGKAASVVRGFRALYLGLVFNCLIMATVNLAACKIAGVLFGLDRFQTLAFVGLLNVAFAAHSGLWGVLVIDMIQFFIKMTAVIAAAYFALQAPQVGGLDGLITKLSSMRGPGGVDYLRVLPDFSNNWDIALAVFIMPIAVQWWAVWYPGAEPGGGSYVAQRMLASKSERDALGAVLFFNVAHYVLRPWPWIIVALASILVYPELSDIQRAFPALDPRLLGHDIAYPAMLKFLPAGFVGLMLGGLIAANSSTILTHLNWGASYLVHDFYRRFIRTDADERHYVMAGRVGTVLLFICSSGLVFLLDSAKGAFDIILQVGAGTGLLYLVRWFWWRVNAWCEVVAMVSSFLVSIVFLVLAKNGVHVSTHFALVLTILATTVCWVTTAYVGPKTDRDVLVRFYRTVRPAGPGWAPIRAISGVSDAELAATGDNIPMALVGWVVGCAAIWSALFTVGNLLYGRYTTAIALLVVFAISSAILIRIVQTLWTESAERADKSV